MDGGWLAKTVGRGEDSGGKDRKAYVMRAETHDYVYDELASSVVCTCPVLLILPEFLTDVA